MPRADGTRMIECCDGGDLAVSDELFRPPEMAPFLNPFSKPPEPLQVYFLRLRCFAPSVADQGFA